MCLKVPPMSLPRLTEHVAAEQDRGYEPPAHRGLGIDVLGHQRLEHGRALGVADEHESAAVVVLLQIGGERCADVGEPEGRVGCGGGLAGWGARERGLPVHRRVHAAVLRVARGLIERDRAFRRADRQVRVPGGLCADRGIDVEAVDRRVLDPLGVEHADLLEPRCVDGRGQAGGAGIRRVTRASTATRSSPKPPARWRRAAPHDCDRGRDQRKSDPHDAPPRPKLAVRHLSACVSN